MSLLPKHIRYSISEQKLHIFIFLLTSLVSLISNFIIFFIILRISMFIINKSNRIEFFFDIFLGFPDKTIFFYSVILLSFSLLILVYHDKFAVNQELFIPFDSFIIILIISGEIIIFFCAMSCNIL